MIFSSVVDAIGHTPVVRLRHEGPGDVELYAKLELQNLFGMKDRVAKQAILEARRTGELTPGAPVIESSSGTMALGVALVGTSLGHPVHIVTDPRIDPITLAKLRALGCAVHVVEAMSAAGWQSARLERLAQLMDELPGAFCPQQYQNPDNPLAYRALAAELLEDLGSLDTVVGSVGSGGSLCGTSRVLRQSLPGLRVVGVDCVGSVLFDQPDRPRRLQSGLGNSLHPANLDSTLIDEVHWLNDHEAFAATRDLAREQNVFGGNTSGSVYQVMRHLAAQASPGSRIVGIFPDRGDRYTGTVYDDEHWRGADLSSQPRRRTPVRVPYGQEVTAWSCAELRRSQEPRKLIFVESNTTGTGMLALDKARELGLEPLFLTADPERYQGLAERACETVRCDTNSLSAVRRTLRNTIRREDCAGVTTTSEFYLPLVAELARWLALPGNPPEVAALCRDKAQVRRALADAGLCRTRFATADRPEDVAEAVRRVGLPCVVKPVDDSGSVDVVRCASADRAEAAARSVLGRTFNVRGQRAAPTALIEEYLDGPEYSVEMFGTGDETICVGITEKHVTDGPHFVEYRHVFPAVLPPALAARIETVVSAALAAVGFRHGASHTEVRVNDDNVSVIEINGRPAGGMIPELVRLSSGTDLLAEQLGAAAGLSVKPRADQESWAGVQFLTADRDGVLSGFDGLEEAGRLPGVTHVVPTAEPGRTVCTPRQAYDRLGYVIAQGPTRADVIETLDRASGLIRIRLTDPVRPGAA
ncbi:pyridoxal-phosphate dependent enzyme [Streptomyces sp. NRRL B-24085]|uniref:pyridoxal-phosphate dependent enzyme n=1 Tax=Streptomyces sp. NRRL B-24085 TaxID=1709476 RepID=UPI0006B3251E|nr:pyridoxal-phosphate dependent enzyme [Streptomyces sp. NRRL B-24085]